MRPHRVARRSAPRRDGLVPGRRAVVAAHQHDLARGEVRPGVVAQRVGDLPVTDKALLMANFERFNIAGVSARNVNVGSDACTSPRPDAPMMIPPASSPMTTGIRSRTGSASRGPSSATTATRTRIENDTDQLWSAMRQGMSVFVSM